MSSFCFRHGMYSDYTLNMFMYIVVVAVLLSWVYLLLVQLDENMNPHLPAMSAAFKVESVF